jgi:hypothetical protein
MVIVDEIHKGNADCYAQVLRTLHPRYIYTLTGTPERKDCLTKGSLISTPNGQVPIEEMKVGDAVFAYTGDEMVESVVVETHVRPAWQRLIRIHHENGTLEVTPDEQIWVVNRGCYVEAKDLTPDDELLLI